MTNHYAICLFLTFLVTFATCSDEVDDTRDQKLISTFQVVRFPNDGCTGSNSRNGTCYTSQECSNKGGTSSGSCADGFGVCCTFLIETCGSSSSENVTAWKQPSTVEAGVCSLTVMPVSDDICSLRLDFTNFVISGPSTLTVHTGRRRFGQGTEGHFDQYVLEGVNWATNCFTDALYIQGASPSSNPPVICGTNTGHHMYVEADTERGNKLQFHLADMATVQPAITRGIGALATRTWDITISHIECTSLTLPPNGCTKYFWNAAGVATLTNYNRGVAGTDAAGTIHLAQQHERMCIRRERGNCVACFAAAATGFDVSGGAEYAAVNLTAPGGCCGYTTPVGINTPGTLAALVEQNGWSNALGGQFGWDCVIIPGAYFSVTTDEGDVQAVQTTALMQQVIGIATIGAVITGTANVPQGPQICGSGAGIGPGVPILSQTTSLDANAAILDEGYGAVVGVSVCTRRVPFILEFMTDDIEGQGSAEGEYVSAAQAFNQGFTIAHTQLAC